MNKLIIALMAIIMLSITGCASSGKTSAPVASGTPIDIGDGAALPEIDAVDDEAVDALADMVAAE